MPLSWKAKGVIDALPLGTISLAASATLPEMSDQKVKSGYASG
jgi:hypothetical protein